MLWLALACVLVAIGCRRGGGPVEAPASLDARLAEQLLGTTAEVAFLLDLEAIRNDPVYARILSDRRVDSNRDVAWVASRIDRIEVWVVDVDHDTRDVTGLAVLHSGRVRESDFGATGVSLSPMHRRVLPSGVVMYQDDSRRLHAAVFLVDGSVVLAAGAAIASAENHFSRSRKLPTALDWGRGALSGAYGRRPVFSRMGDKYADHVLEASVVWRTGNGGEIVAGASFDDDASVDRTMGMLAEVTEARTPYLSRCPALADVGVATERTGRSVSVRITGLRALIVAGLEGRCG